MMLWGWKAAYPLWLGSRQAWCSEKVLEQYMSKADCRAWPFTCSGSRRRAETRHLSWTSRWGHIFSDQESDANSIRHFELSNLTQGRQQLPSPAV